MAENEQKNFRIWFWNLSRLTKIEVQARTEEEAIKKAVEVCMERYGYLPTHLHQVDRFSS